MANIKSSQLDIRRIAKRTVRNRSVISELKTHSKKVEALSDSDDAAAKKDAATKYISALEKAAKRNIVHGNKVSRKKAKYAKYLAA